MEEDDVHTPFEGEGSPVVAMPVSGSPGMYIVDGAGVQLADLQDREEFSTVVFQPGGDDWSYPREAFGYGQSQGIPGDMNRAATRADTSLVRAGSFGLPSGWAGFVFGWRASVLGPQDVINSDVFTKWAASVLVKLRYNQWTYAQLPLIELLRVPRPVVGDAMPPEITALKLGALTIPMHLRDNLPFDVELASERGAENDALRRALIIATGVDERHKMLLMRLECIGGAAIAAVITELRPQPIQIRIFLRGWWQRSVV